MTEWSSTTPWLANCSNCWMNSALPTTRSSNTQPITARISTRGPMPERSPFHGEKNSNWEGAYRVPAFVRWPGKFPADTTLNGIVSHEDWLPTFAAIAGAPDIKEKLLAGVELNGRDI